jgi:phosphatidylglycerophosphate synthase
MNVSILRKTPFLVVFLRILLTPVFFIIYVIQQQVIAILVYVVIILSDVLDGYLARRIALEPASTIEAYLDPVADFFFVIIAFIAFSLGAIYPVWLVGIFILMFLFFLMTSNKEEPVYDPIGKYYGFFLMGAIGLTLVFTNSYIFGLVLISIILYTSILLVTRIAFLLQKRKDENLNSLKDM